MENKMEKFGLLIHWMDRLFKKNINSELAKIKLTSIDLAVIMDLYFQKKIGSEESRTENIMAERLLVDKKKFKKIIDNLVKNDWIVKIPNQIDRRINEIFLSAKSASIIEYLISSYSYSEDRAFAGFSDDEKKETIDYLNRILNNLKL